MAITITLANDDNHSIASSKKILSRQGELGEVVTEQKQTLRDITKVVDTIETVEELKAVKCQ